MHSVLVGSPAVFTEFLKLNALVISTCNTVQHLMNCIITLSSIHAVIDKLLKCIFDYLYPTIWQMSNYELVQLF